MDNNATQGHPEGCKCGMCQSHAMGGCMCGHRHWGHILIKIVIAIFIFWAGVQFGELKGTFHNEYHGYGMMGSYGGGNQWGGPSMMQRCAPGTAPQPLVGTTTRK